MTTLQERLRPAPVTGLPALVRLDWNASYWPLAGIAVVLLLQAMLVFQRAINWDEFYHYSQVQLFAQGTLSQPLQTFYVRLFQWLPALPGTGVDHIVVARILMFLCEIVTAAAIALLAARFSDRTVGLLCALCYLSAGFVLQHGFSFRADPVDAALLTSALCILAWTRLRAPHVIALGVLLALAALYTIKFVLYAPAFLGLAWWRWRGDGYRSAVPFRLLVAGGVAAAVFGLLLAYHSQTVPEAVHSGSGVLHASAQKMFRLGVPVYWIYIVKAALLSPLFVALILLVPFALQQSPLRRSAPMAIWGLLLPIAVLAFYHNTAPYFYAFILPPVAAACAVPMTMAVRRFGAAPLSAAFALTAFCLWMAEDRGILDRQRALLVAADTIFPGKISYFDFCAMLARQDKANIFMTPWGSELYRQGNEPPMREVMKSRVVPLVIENDPMFTRLLRSIEPVPEFLSGDAAALRETYLPYWGPFWVAGKIIPANAREQRVEILVPGPYTLAGGAVEVDGRALHPGEVVTLARGVHRLMAAEGKAARLTWGDHLRKPAGPPPPEPYWTAF